MVRLTPQLVTIADEFCQSLICYLQAEIFIAKSRCYSCSPCLAPFFLHTWHSTSCNACHKTTTEVCSSGLNQTAGTYDRVLELSRKGDTFPTIVLECESPSLCSRDEAQETWFPAAESRWHHLWIFYQSSPCKRHLGRRSWSVLYLALQPLVLAPIKFWR